ncbi:MAG: glutamine-hydrolyzing carbamoyl-phosphate synthase small subunit [Chloroflexota bacterium]
MPENLSTASIFPPATLALADGRVFRCRAFGALETKVAEVVFNTSLTGYQEILTDPSYCGQFVVMTYPHIGNVGINPDDMEANSPWAAGLLVREVCAVPSNYRSTQSLPDYLENHQIPGLTELDTRALVRHIRSQGAMMGALSSDQSLNEQDLIRMAQESPSMEGCDLVQEVTCPEPYHWQDGVLSEWRSQSWAASSEKQYRVVAYDFGIKHNILRLLSDLGCDVTVLPANAPAADALALNPDGIFLSNGPGDPAAVSYGVETVRDLADTGKPMFGICLGHQILALALGGQTHKMKFGHRGGNQPVQTIAAPVESNGETGPVAITSHNHGFAVTPNSLPDTIEVTHINLNDQCIEGLQHKEKPIFSIQYHPEASPGPHDAVYLFEQFKALMDSHS